MPGPEQQRSFLDTFGFLVLPAFLADEIAWIAEEFERVVASRDSPEQEGTLRCAVMDRNHPLFKIGELPKVRDLVSGLLGDGYTYLGCDARLFSGHTTWHRDGPHPAGTFLAFAIYLDPLTAESGSLRLVPGGHRAQLDQYWDTRALWGVEPSAVPATSVASEPGDLIVFNHNVPHSSFGGGPRRRMLRLNFCSAQETTQGEAALGTQALDEILRWSGLGGHGGDAGTGARAIATAVQAKAPDFQNPEVVLSMNSIMEKLIARQVVASDLFARAEDGEALEFVGRLLFSPLPVLVVEKGEEPGCRAEERPSGRPALYGNAV